MTNSASLPETRSCDGDQQSEKESPRPTPAPRRRQTGPLRPREPPGFGPLHDPPKRTKKLLANPQGRRGQDRPALLGGEGTRRQWGHSEGSGAQAGAIYKAHGAPRPALGIRGSGLRPPTPAAVKRAASPSLPRRGNDSISLPSNCF